MPKSPSNDRYSSFYQNTGAPLQIRYIDIGKQKERFPTHPSFPAKVLCHPKSVNTLIDKEVGSRWIESRKQTDFLLSYKYPFVNCKLATLTRPRTTLPLPHPSGIIPAAFPNTATGWSKEIPCWRWVIRSGPAADCYPE